MPCLLQIRVTVSVSCVSLSISMHKLLRQALLIWLPSELTGSLSVVQKDIFYKPVQACVLSSVDVKVFCERHSLKIFETWLLKS